MKASAPRAPSRPGSDEGAAYLLDKDADRIEQHWWAIFGSWPPSGIGLEARVLWMMGQALWDLFAKRAGLPLVGVLGGAVRPNIRAYNTCAGPAYGEDSAPGGDYAGIRQPGGEYEDLWAFRNQADVLAEDLIATGFGAMKIWPFDEMADETGGKAISQQQLARGLEPIRKIREKVGNRIDVAIELHARWDVATAMVIAHALEPYNPLWIEDPIWFDNPAEMAQMVGAHTSSTIAAGEKPGAFYRYTELIASGLGLVIADPMFVGGVTAIHRVADLAGQHRRSFASHDCAGPVNLAVGTHLALPWRTRGTRRWCARSTTAGIRRWRRACRAWNRVGCPPSTRRATGSRCGLNSGRDRMPTSRRPPIGRRRTEVCVPQPINGVGFATPRQLREREAVP